MSKFGSIVLGVAAGTVASIGILFALDKDKTLCKRNSIGDKVDGLKDQLDSLTRKMRDKSMELKGSLEEKVDNLLSDSDNKPEDLYQTIRKEISLFERKS